MTAIHVLDTSPHRIASTKPRRSTWEVQALSFVVSDLVAFAAAAAAAAAIVGIANGFAERPLIDRTFDHFGILGSVWHGWSLILILGVSLVQFHRSGHYSQRVPFWTATRDVIGVCLVALSCDLFISLKIYNVKFEAGQALCWLLFAGLILVLRGITASLLSRAGVWTLRTLVIGPEHAARRVAKALRSDASLGLSVIGMLTRPLASIGNDVRQWEELVAGRGADYVALVANPADPAGDALIVAALNRTRVPFVLVHSVSALPVCMARPQYLMSHDILMMTAHNALSNPFKRAAKRAFDIVAAGLLLLLLSPLMLAITFMVRRGAGPALYPHDRVGFGGRTFGCLKFRSMSVNGDEMLAELLANDPSAAAEWAATRKLRNDPRIEPLGHFLRSTSLDELPQLINVLRGEMSLVGPRPIVQSELSFYGDDAEYYMQARPGMTGLWQVSGRSDTTYDERVHLDAWYVRNWTLWHDLAILMKTIPVVLLRRGAV